MLGYSIAVVIEVKMKKIDKKAETEVVFRTRKKVSRV